MRVPRNVNLLIASLGVILRDVSTDTSNQQIKIEPFDDECVFISKLLSITDKLIYVVISNKCGDFVVPLIHDHPYIDRIYVHRAPEDESSLDWTNDYAKIMGQGSSLDILVQQMQDDIQSTIQRPSRGSKSKALSTELHTQNTQYQFSIPSHDLLGKDLRLFRIVLLHLNERRLFHLTHPKIQIEEYYTIEACQHSIQADASSTVFLIVSVDHVTDMQTLVEFESVNAIYIVTDMSSIVRLQAVSTCPKLSGFFVLNEDLLEQLTADICFYLEHRYCKSRMDIFDLQPDFPADPTQSQIDFLSFQLFTEILSQLPIQSTANTNNKELCSRLIEGNVLAGNLFQQFDRSTLEKSVPELKGLTELLMSLPKQLRDLPTTVYRAQLASPRDLEMIKNNPNALLSVRAFLLASRSFSPIANICRRAANNQLPVLFFELSFPRYAPPVDLDNNGVVFNIGTLFRIVSTDATPDGIWRAQLEVATGAMTHIKNQLYSKIGRRLTWLTFGSYLAALKLEDQNAEEYYHYLRKLASNHASLGSIYNNMGLMYMAQEKTEEALKWFQQALELSKRIPSILDTQRSIPMEVAPSSTDSPIDHRGTLEMMAEMSYANGDFTAAMDFYQQELELTSDPVLGQNLQIKIDSLSHFNAPCSPK